MKVHFINKVILLMVVLLLGLMISSKRSDAQEGYYGGTFVPPASYNGVPNIGSPTGVLSSCGYPRSGDGKSVAGVTAGLQAGGNVCFSGGDQSFCSAMESSTYQCASLNIIEGAGVDIAWRDFDISEEEKKDVQESYYQLSTRDATRGRSGYDMPLFMNAHGVCRKIDNKEKKELPLFMGVSTPEEWRTVHGVPAGGDPNGGYTVYANEKSPLIGAKMNVCCAPVILNICGSPVQIDYAQVGDIVSVWGASGGHASVECFANNDWRVHNLDGICGGGGEGGGGSESGSGMYNPNSGGEMSKQEWDNLSGGVQNALKEQGYRDIKDTTPKAGDKNIKAPPEDVKAANQQAKADTIAAKEAAEEKARQQEIENKRKEEEAKKAAEDAQREKEERERAEDDDDNT